MSATKSKKCKTPAIDTWSKEDKEALLEALEAHGPENLSKIKDCLPRKSGREIKEMILKYKAMANLDTKDVNSLLSVWLGDSMFQINDSLVAQAILLIHLFEKHPPPEETAGFDVKECYKFLYHTLKGDPLKNLPERTASMFKDLQYSTDKEIWPSNEQVVIDYLTGILGRSAAEKVYKRRRKHS